MAATLALSAESFVGRAEMVTGSYEISTGAYVETLHGARTVPTAEGARATNPRGGKGVNPSTYPILCHVPGLALCAYEVTGGR